MALRRPDVWPAGDLALIVGAQIIWALADRPTPAWVAERAAAWSPWRAVAARLLWSEYLAHQACGDAATTGAEQVRDRFEDRTWGQRARVSSPKSPIAGPSLCGDNCTPQAVRRRTCPTKASRSPVNQSSSQHQSPVTQPTNAHLLLYPERPIAEQHAPARRVLAYYPCGDHTVAATAGALHRNFRGLGRWPAFLPGALAPNRGHVGADGSLALLFEEKDGPARLTALTGAAPDLADGWCCSTKTVPPTPL